MDEVAQNIAECELPRRPDERKADSLRPIPAAEPLEIVSNASVLDALAQVGSAPAEALAKAELSPRRRAPARARVLVA